MSISPFDGKFGLAERSARAMFLIDVAHHLFLVCKQRGAPTRVTLLKLQGGGEGERNYKFTGVESVTHDVVSLSGNTSATCLLLPLLTYYVNVKFLFLAVFTASKPR